MLAALRLVLATVTQRFSPDLFLQFPLMSKSPDEVREFLQARDCVLRIEGFLVEFTQDVRSASRASGPVMRLDSDDY